MGRAGTRAGRGRDHSVDSPTAMTTTMTATSGTPWETTTAGEVRVGDRVRLRDQEITVSRIEPSFLALEGMIAFVEDTDERWLKAPAPSAGPVEVRRGG